MLFSKQEPVRLVKIHKGMGKNDKPYARVKIGEPSTFDTVEAFLSVPKEQTIDDFTEGQSYLASVRISADAKSISIILSPPSNLMLPK